jgi:PiT family inorganic phosphate transporter
VFASVLGIGSLWVVRNSRPGRVDRWFRRLQLVSSAAFSFSHGSNDAQKTIGIILGLLVTSNVLFADPGTPREPGTTGFRHPHGDIQRPRSRIAASP